MRKLLLTGATILSLPALTACGPTRIETVKPPIALTECADEPLAPNLPGRNMQEERDSMTLAYIIALRTAYGDCKADVVALKEWSAGL
jgi:hypothetical protein